MRLVFSHGFKRFEALLQRFKCRVNKGWTMYKNPDNIYYALFYVFYSEKKNGKFYSIHGDSYV